MLKKKKIIIPGLVVILLVGIAAAVIYFFDLNRFKPLISRTVKHYTGRELTINGDIRLLELWPPTLMAEDIAFQNASWGSKPHMVRVKQAAFSVSLKSILRGEFRFSHIRLQGPEVLLEFNQAGVSNFLFDIPETEEEVAVPVLAFNDILIQNGYFEYNDQRWDLNASVRVDDLQADIPGLDKSIQILFEGNFRDLPCSLDGSIGPIIAWIQPGFILPVDLSGRLGGASAQLKGDIRDPVHLKDISLHFTADGPSTREMAGLVGRGSVPDLGAFTVKAELTDRPGRLAIDKLAVQIGAPDLVSFSIAGMVGDLIAMKGFDLDLGIQTRDTGNLMHLAGVPPPPFKAPLTARVTFSDTAKNQYSLDDFVVSMGDRTIQGQMDLDLTRAHPVLEMQLQSENTTLGPLALKTRMSGSLDRVSVEHLELQMGHDNLFKAFVNGTVGNVSPLEDLHLNFHILGKDLAHLQKLTNRPLPVQGPYAISGTLLMAGHKAIHVPELKIILGKNSINGSLGLEMNHEYPMLHVNLFSSRLNLEQLLAPKILPDNLHKNLSSVGPSRLEFELSGPIEHPTLERINLQTQVENLAKLNLKGSIKNLLTMTGADLHLAVKGTDLTNLAKVVGQDIPFKGPYSLSGKLLRPDKTAFHIENVKISAAANNFHGRSVIKRSKSNIVASVYLGTKNISLEALNEGQSAVLDRLKLKKDLGPLEIKASAVLSATGHRLQNFDLAFGKDEFIRMHINGSMGNLTGMQGMHFKFQASGRNISSIESIAGRRIPLKGAYALSGEISGHAPHNILLRKLDLMLARNHFTGRADLNLAGEHPVVDSEILADHFSLVPIMLEEIDPLKNIPDMGPLKLAFTLSEASGVPAITHLELRLGRESTIAVMLRGSIGNLDPLGEVTLDFTIDSQDLSILNNAYGSGFIKGKPFHAMGRLNDPRLEKITVTSFEASYGDSNLSGAASLDLSLDRPKMNAALSSKKMDLRPLIKIFGKSDRLPQMPSRSATPKDRVFSREPFNLTALHLLDITVAFQARELLLQNIAVNDVEISLQLSKGDLNVDPLKFSIGGGTAEGTFVLQASKSPLFMATSLAVHHFDIGPMLEQLDQESTLQGTLNTSIYLHGSGNSVAALMVGLDGKVHLDIHDGRIESRQLALLERYLGSNILDLINPFIKHPPHTAINCLITTATIRDGLADFKMILDTEQTALASAGTIDLKTERLNIGIKPSPKKGFGDVHVGYISFSLKELSQPFGLGGTLKRPHLILDPTRTVFTAAKFSGAVLLGPVGITLFFSDISLGKKNICEEASAATPGN